MNIVAIDPGLSGAIAELNEKGEIVHLIDMPVLSYKKGKKVKRDYDVGAISGFFTLMLKERTVFIEKMQSMPPGFRVQASFGLGYCQGLFEGILSTLGIGYELIISKEWKKHFSITPDKGDGKAQSFQIASRLFPEAELKTKRGRILDGRSDALLICEYGRRKIFGGWPQVKQ